MKRLAFTILASLWLILPAIAAEEGTDDAEANLTATFIGNEAFAITDGEVTLVSDFPYQSGYSLYMEYDPAALEIKGEVVSLITHRHADHFDAELFRATDWWIVGPREITDGISKSRVIPLPKKGAEPVEFFCIKVQPVETAHSTTEHFSYLVTWHGKKLYFFGDTETADEFLALGGEVDVAFMTPWVLRGFVLDETDIPAKQVIIYHQQVGEPLPQCDKCRALRQGESFLLD